MKKAIMIILLGCITCMSISAVEASVTLGAQKKQSLYQVNDPLYVTINIWKDLGRLQIYGEYTNEMAQTGKKYSFKPSQDYFTVGAQIDFEIFTVKLEHLCIHPVATYRVPLTNGYGGYTQFEITIGDSRK